MKKLFMLALIFASLCCLSGCFLHYDNDDQLAMNKMTEILEVIEGGQPEDIKDLFAPAILEKDIQIDENIAKLLLYYKGSLTSIKGSGGLYVSETIVKGRKIKNFKMGYYVTTTKNEYCVAVDWCSDDYADSDNIGVHRLYVISRNDNPDEDMYWGDAQGRIGIQVNKPYAGIYMENLLDCIRKKDKEGFKALFSAEAQLVADIDRNIDTLYSIFDGNYDIVNSTAEYYETENSSGYCISYYALKGWDKIETTYSICLKWCVDSEEGDIGALSFYITKTDGSIDMDMNSPYWGNGNWDNGVHMEQ